MAIPPGRGVNRHSIRPIDVILGGYKRISYIIKLVVIIVQEVVAAVVVEIIVVVNCSSHIYNSLCGRQ